MKREWVPVFSSVCNAGRMRKLPDNTCRLFYLLLVTQCDPHGRVVDDAGSLWAACWATFGPQCSPEETERAILALEAVGLIERHATATERWIQVPDWEQKAGKIGERLKRGESSFPPPSSDTLVTKSRVSRDRLAPKSNTEERRVDRDQIREEEQIRGEHIPPPPATAAAVPTSRPIPNTPHHQFIAYWMDAFLAVQGRPYGFDDKKDGAQVKSILKLAGGSLEIAKERAHILLHAAPEWIDEGGRDLGTLRSQWNKLVSMGTGRTSGSKQSLITESLTGKPAGIGLFAHRKPKELKP